MLIICSHKSADPDRYAKTGIGLRSSNFHSNPPTTTGSAGFAADLAVLKTALIE